MRSVLIALAVLAVAAPAAFAHPERHAFFPDGSVGAVPKHRKTADQVIYVCKKDSAKRVRRSFRHQPQLRARRLRQLKACHNRNIQAAVNQARSGAIIRIFPGVYREQPSRKAPEPDPKCANDYDEIGSSLLASGVAGNGGGAKVANFEYQRTCPNAQNLIAIIGDGPDEDRVCDHKCNLQIEGIGRKRTDVLISGQRTKLNVIRADRADGIYLRHFTVEYSDFNNIYILETNGFRMEDIKSRWSREYGFLSFTSDHGLYNRLEAFGSGDSGVYPGSGPEGHCARYGIEIKHVNSHNNTIGYSGTAGNGVWAHDNAFHHNSTGMTTDSFASDHGLYNRLEAFGSGDSGVYPGSGPEGHCARYGIEIKHVNSHNNTIGYSGTAGNGVWAHDNAFHHNSTGMTTDSFASGHPGMPQDCAKWEHNRIYSNNADYFNDQRDAYCNNTPIPERNPRIVCPTFQVPVGTGIGIFGGNGDIVRDNYFYDNWRDAVKLLYVPAAFRGEPDKGIDTSFDDKITGNHMGVRPDGTRDPNGNDVWWDEQGRGNCFSGNVGPNGAPPTSNVVTGLPDCPGSSVLMPGIPTKTASQATCSTWDPFTNPDPPGCDWFTRPEEPKS